MIVDEGDGGVVVGVGGVVGVGVGVGVVVGVGVGVGVGAGAVVDHHLQLQRNQAYLGRRPVKEYRK